MKCYPLNILNQQKSDMDEICKNCIHFSIPTPSPHIPASNHANRGYCKLWFGWIDIDETCECFNDDSPEAYKYAQGNNLN